MDKNQNENIKFDSFKKYFQNPNLITESDLYSYTYINSDSFPKELNKLICINKDDDKSNSLPNLRHFLNNNKHSILIENVTFKDISEVNKENLVPNLKNILSELFPIEYSEIYLNNLINKSKEKEGIIILAILTVNEIEFIIGLVYIGIVESSFYINSLYRSSSIFSLYYLKDFVKNYFINNFYGHIKLLGLIQEFRGLGLGKKLFKESLKRFDYIYSLKNDLKNFKGFYLEVALYNKTAIEFYKKMGFEILNDSSFYYLINGKDYEGKMLIKYCNN